MGRGLLFHAVVVCAVWLASRPAMATPDIKSAGAVILDYDSGAVIYGKHADDVRPIASTTKIFVAMIVRRRGIDLDAWTEITKVDAAYAKGGARTRLDVGQSFRNVDLLRAMLMASDNRAPTALARAAGLSPSELVREMNALAKELRLTHTRFTDPSGLRGNVSTPREMALAMRRTLADATITSILRTDVAHVRSRSGRINVTYGNTNAPLTQSPYKILGGKTGYTDAARYCFVTGAEIKGKRVLMSFFGAEGKLTRFADFSRAADWMASGGGGGRVSPGVRPPHTARAKRPSKRR